MNISYIAVIMAIIDDNQLLSGASGTFGRQFVLRRRNGKTIMCKMPGPYKPKTETQLANQERFKKANDYAKAAIADPVIKAHYQQLAENGQTAYNMALKEAHHGPELQNITVKNQTVTIQARDNYILETVKVTVLSPSGAAIETGLAALAENKNDWEYVIKSTAKDTTIKAEAQDKAGNINTMLYTKP